MPRRSTSRSSSVRCKEAEASHRGPARWRVASCTPMEKQHARARCSVVTDPKAIHLAHAAQRSRRRAVAAVQRPTRGLKAAIWSAPPEGVSGQGGRNATRASQAGAQMKHKSAALLPRRAYARGALRRALGPASLGSAYEGEVVQDELIGSGFSQVTRKELFL